VCAPGSAAPFRPPLTVFRSQPKKHMALISFIGNTFRNGLKLPSCEEMGTLQAGWAARADGARRSAILRWLVVRLARWAGWRRQRRRARRAREKSDDHGGRAWLTRKTKLLREIYGARPGIRRAEQVRRSILGRQGLLLEGGAWNMGGFSGTFRSHLDTGLWPKRPSNPKLGRAPASHRRRPTGRETEATGLERRVASVPAHVSPAGQRIAIRRKGPRKQASREACPHSQGPSGGMRVMARESYCYGTVAVCWAALETWVMEGISQGTSGVSCTKPSSVL